MKKPHAFRVGLFVFIGLALVAGLLLQFSKGTTFFRQTYEVLLRAPNVGGLKPRADVLMAGVKVGTVSDIKLGPEGTNVTMTLKIYRQFLIHKDAHFLIQQSGFLGDQYVAIVPTNNQDETFADHDRAIADAPFDMQEVARSAGGLLQRLDETAKKLNEAIVDVRKLVLNEQTLTNLSTAVGNIRVVSERALVAVDNVNVLVTSNSPSVSTAVSNLVFFSEQVNLFAKEFSNVLTTNTTEFSSAVKNIESSTVVLKNLMNDLESGKGLAGNVLKNEELSADVSQIAKNLSITTSNLNRLGLWGIMRQRKPPKAETPPPKTAPSPKNRID